MLTKQGIITSTKMQRTIAVTVHSREMHPLYHKSFRKSKKFLADTNGMEDLAVGDEVVIQECVRMSKNKYFKLVDVVRRVPRVSEMMDEKNVDEEIHREKEEKKEVAAPASSESSTSDTPNK